MKKEKLTKPEPTGEQGLIIEGINYLLFLIESDRRKGSEQELRWFESSQKHPSFFRGQHNKLVDSDLAGFMKRKLLDLLEMQGKFEFE